MRYTLAYPQWDDTAAADVVAAHRARHDAAQAAVVAPHVTLVFPQADALPLDAYIAHVQSVARQQALIRIACRCTLYSPDPREHGLARQYLMPDEGLSALVYLHSRLYAGPLAAARPLEQEFLPHITIGTFTDTEACLRECHRWNQAPPVWWATLGALTVAELQRGRIVDLVQLPLGASV